MGHHSGYYCSNCKAEVNKYADDCPSCKHLFINNEAGIAKAERIRTVVKRRGGAIKLLLAFALTGLFLSAAFVGGMAESGGNDDLAWIILGTGGLVVIISLIGIILSCQYIKLVRKMGRRATVKPLKSSEQDLEISSEPDLQASNSSNLQPPIYEYHDDGFYKWICGFCDGENTTDEASCPICGYLRIQR